MSVRVFLLDQSRLGFIPLQILLATATIPFLAGFEGIFMVEMWVTLLVTALNRGLRSFIKFLPSRLNFHGSFDLGSSLS